MSALIDTVTIASIVIIVAAVLIAVAAMVISRARAKRLKGQVSLPRLVIPVSPEAAKGPPVAARAASTPPAAMPAVTPPPSTAPTAAFVVREEHVASDIGEHEGRPRALDPKENVLQFAPRENGGVNGRRDGREMAPAEALGGETVQFRRPTDEPLQLLPGRLEILQGENAGQDIRFVRVLGETPQIIFGREAGPAHRNVTLHSPTVSRRHACLEFSKGRWTITNLSHTNPVLVNDEELAAAGETRALHEGDRIELGEVVFRFRSR